MSRISDRLAEAILARRAATGRCRWQDLVDQGFDPQEIDRHIVAALNAADERQSRRPYPWAVAA